MAKLKTDIVCIITRSFGGLQTTYKRHYNSIYVDMADTTPILQYYYYIYNLPSKELSLLQFYRNGFFLLEVEF